MSAPGPWPDGLVLPGGREVALGWCEVGAADVTSLSPAEREGLARCGTGKRRHEFLAGRVAAHRALARLVPGPRADVSAHTRGPDSGRPFFPSVPDVALSISHSAGLAVAAVARGGALGVDLERTLEVGPAFLEEAFAPGEPEGYAAVCAGRVEPLTAAWTLKEAVLKVWGVGLRAPLQQVRLQPTLLHARQDVLALRLTLELGRLPPDLGLPPTTLAALLVWKDGQVLALAG